MQTIAMITNVTAEDKPVQHLPLTAHSRLHLQPGACLTVTRPVRVEVAAAMEPVSCLLGRHQVFPHIHVSGGPAALPPRQLGPNLSITFCCAAVLTVTGPAKVDAALLDDSGDDVVPPATPPNRVRPEPTSPPPAPRKRARYTCTLSSSEEEEEEEKEPLYTHGHSSSGEEPLEDDDDPLYTQEASGSEDEYGEEEEGLFDDDPEATESEDDRGNYCH